MRSLTFFLQGSDPVSRSSYQGKIFESYTRKRARKGYSQSHCTTAAVDFWNRQFRLAPRGNFDPCRRSRMLRRTENSNPREKSFGRCWDICKSRHSCSPGHCILLSQDLKISRGACFARHIMTRQLLNQNPRSWKFRAWEHFLECAPWATVSSSPFH